MPTIRWIFGRPEQPVYDQGSLNSWASTEWSRELVGAIQPYGRCEGQVELRLANSDQGAAAEPVMQVFFTDPDGIRLELTNYRQERHRRFADWPHVS